MRCFLVLLLACSWAVAQTERTLESKFDSFLRPSDLETWMKHMTAHPHHTSSAQDKANAEYIASLFTSWGYDTHIEEFYILFPTPKTRLLEMTAPSAFTAVLQEPPLAEDKTSAQTKEQLPSYNAYSIDGDVTGELVYVNYGIPKDYEELAKRGIDVKGKVVISRYGGAWRGIKPKVAAEHGAIGCIIYSDPKDDGYYDGDVYPLGAYRSDEGVQRGSVEDMPLYNGDPLTPGIGATKDAKRLAIKDAKTLTTIPVLPISYGDALPLLKALGGPVAPDAWRGALPITYHIGPGKTIVHFKLAFRWDIVPIYDVVATMKGFESPDEWIMRGNHHDGWVYGAGDPVSGLVAMLEEAHGLSELAKQGWKPKRSIMYCAWDGEEEGLMGSTEYVETHVKELQQHAVVYINSDGNGRGFFGASGSHTLERFVNDVAKDVTDPEKGVSVLERALALRSLSSGSDDQQTTHDRSYYRIGALGSGSDYTAFIDFAGIASLNLGYGGEDGGGSYHSIYDSYDFFTRFVDPGFRYGVTLAKTAGRMVIRLSTADVLPFAFSPLAETLSKYGKEVQKLADDMRAETDEHNRRVQEKTYDLVADPQQPFVSPRMKDPVPFINFTPLQNALKQFDVTARTLDSAIAKRGGNLNKDATFTLNEVLRAMEQSLTRNDGLPRRSWYKHQVYAPGFYTGYGVKTLPGIREAIEQRSWKEAEQQAAVVAGVLDGYTTKMQEAAAFIMASAK